MVSSITGGSGPSAAALKKIQDEIFKKNDLNGDGKISKDELTQVAAQSAKSTPGSAGQKGPTADEIMTSMDTDKDGSISRLESDAGVAKVTQQMQAQGAGRKGAPPPGGPPSGGPPPSGGSAPSGTSGGSGSTKSYDKKDTNKDGTVSDLEELAYALKHPETATKTSSSASAKTGSTAETAAARTYNAQTGTTANATVAGPELNVSI